MKNSEDLITQVITPKISKGERKKISILRGALQVLADKGAEGLNYNVIGKEIGENRALVAHYFPDKVELLMSCVEVMALEAQQLTVEKLKTAKNQKQVLSSFIDGAVDLFDVHSGYMSIMLLLYHYCTVDDRVHEFHENFREMGAKRIQTAMNQMSVQKKSTKFAYTQARMVQRTIRSLILENHLSPSPVSSASLKKKIHLEIEALREGL